MPHSPRDTQTFYRETPVDDLGMAARRLGATNLRLRCPACGRGAIGNGFFSVRDRCPQCGSRFDRLAGNELISIALGFFFACLITIAAALLLVMRFGFFEGITFVLLAVGAASVLLLARTTRTLALWLLWMLGFVYPDRVREPGRHELPVTPDADAGDGTNAA